MKYKEKWKEEAVSPVIATILMVAITVVLAAVLYLLVTALIVPPDEKPTVMLSNGIRTGTDGEWRISVDSITKSEPIADFKVALMNGSAVAIEATSLETIKSSGATNGSLVLKFYEPNGDEDLNAGDYFILNGAGDDSQYRMEIYYRDKGLASGKTGKINN